MSFLIHLKSHILRDKMVQVTMFHSCFGSHITKESISSHLLTFFLLFRIELGPKKDHHHQIPTMPSTSNEGPTTRSTRHTNQSCPIRSMIKGSIMIQIDTPETGLQFYQSWTQELLWRPHRARSRVRTPHQRRSPWTLPKTDTCPWTERSRRQGRRRMPSNEGAIPSLPFLHR